MTTISNRQYAEALLKTLGEAPHKNHPVLFKRFLLLLRRRRDSHRLDRILALVEQLFLKEKKYRKVVIESPYDDPQGITREIKKIMGEHIFVQHKKNPALLAGVRLWIDSDIVIDASARRRVLNLFA